MDAGTAKKHDFAGRATRSASSSRARRATSPSSAWPGSARPTTWPAPPWPSSTPPPPSGCSTRSGGSTRIDAVGDGSVSALELRTRVERALPDGYEALTGTQVADEQADQIQDALGFFNTFLLVFAGISLFVGAFMILNTFSILVAQRTRELALLRALGASRGQVLASVVGRGGHRRAGGVGRRASAWASWSPSASRPCWARSASTCPAAAWWSSPARSWSRWSWASWSPWWLPSAPPAGRRSCRRWPPSAGPAPRAAGSLRRRTIAGAVVLARRRRGPRRRPVRATAGSSWSAWARPSPSSAWPC